MDTQNIQTLAINTIRTLAIDAVQKANSGHPGLPMGAAPMAYALWTHFLRHNPKNPQWANRDRFVLSAGHGSMLLYALLHLTGYDLPLEELKHFRQWGSLTPGHPEHGLTPGVETTTGPLGQGFATGVGMAMAEAHLAAQFNRPSYPIIDHYTYGIVSDGDLMEGVASEAASLAGTLKLKKLIYLYDDNQISIEGRTTLAFREDVLTRFSAYGWDTDRVADGNDVSAIMKAIGRARETDKPSLIAVRNIIGYGSPNRQDTPKAHGEALGADEVRLTKAFYGWPEDAEFYIPDQALSHFRLALKRGQEEEMAWNDLWQGYQRDYADLAHTLEQGWAGELPTGVFDDLPQYDEGTALATRAASGEVLNAMAPRFPLLIGGSADLATSNNTHLKDQGDFSPENYNGRNLHFGVREHAMGSALNGMVLHGGLRVYGGTFLIFSDYMKPAIRLASLMKQPVVYVFTHDSIGLGEDGPTHQPVEQLAALRAIPRMHVIRPADANETREAWKHALETKDHPTALALTRQKLPALPSAKTEGLAHGAYILDDAEETPELILIASGSEVSLARQAYQVLTEQGRHVRVVSFPCWELFDQETSSYRDHVLPPHIPRLAIEAASPFGWAKYVGLEGRIIGLDHFGASAPAETLFDRFGFTVDHVVQTAHEMMGHHR